jgi:hypothetical protein
MIVAILHLSLEMINFTFKKLSDMSGVAHGIGSQNVAFEFGTEALLNRENLRKDLDLDTLVSAKQTHSDHIKVFRNGGEVPEIDGVQDEIQDVDAFISDVPGLGLMVKTADCQPILMAAPGVVAIVHSGWRGSLQNIAGKTVARMKSDFGVDPETVVVGVGPSLGPCCAEFSNPEEELTDEALKHRVDDSNRFDFVGMTRDQLLNEGVPEENMEFSFICSKNDPNWFSYRGDDPDVGRFGSVIGLTH